MDQQLWSRNARQLIELARSNPDNMAKLKEIAAVLSGRHELQALIVVGTLIEQATEKGYQARQDNVRAERESQARRRQQGFFDWPSTDAPASRYGFSGDHFSYKEGLLSFVGYQVGRNGLSPETRLQTLDCVFHNKLPNVESPEYMDEWSSPRTPGRLQKMAESIAAFTRNAKRRTSHDLSQAIDDWESDLRYLYDEYYVGTFHFSWPPRDV
jgi:hypothetical protein